MGGKGVFVTEIHDALRREEIDLAVHSAKDMAAVSPEGLTIAAVLAREDPRDALIFAVGRDLNESTSNFQLSNFQECGAVFAGVIGTGSPALDRAAAPALS